MSKQLGAARIETAIPRAHLNNISLQYIEDVKKEKAAFRGRFPLTAALIDQAIDKVHTTGRVPGKEYHCDVSKPVPMKLTEKVYVPVKQFPTFNFVGKILGPKGNTLRRLEQKTQCKISIKGRNSMRDPLMEEQLRKSGEPEYTHLHRSLFIEISTVGLAIDCYTRIAMALEEIRQYLIPDKNDEISQEQWKEISQLISSNKPPAPNTISEVMRVSEPTLEQPIQQSPNQFVLKSILKKPKPQLEPMDTHDNSYTDQPSSSMKSKHSGELNDIIQFLL